VADHLQAGELAKLTGVSTDTLRHYERMGVLPKPARTRSGYRAYAPECVVRVQSIRAALSCGFTLQELARVFGVRDRGGAPCKQARAMLAAKAVELQERIVAMQALQRSLQAILKDWDQRLSQTPEGTRAHLLESLALLGKDRSLETQTGKTRSFGSRRNSASGAGSQAR
jgi:DNA-binding transcriptional MerR regulator